MVKWHMYVFVRHNICLAACKRGKDLPPLRNHTNYANARLSHYSIPHEICLRFVSSKHDLRYRSVLLVLEMQHGNTFLNRSFFTCSFLFFEIGEGILFLYVEVKQV